MILIIKIYSFPKIEIFLCQEKYSWVEERTSVGTMSKEPGTAQRAVPGERHKHTTIEASRAVYSMIGNL